MDPAAPSQLPRLFNAYDVIVSHGRPEPATSPAPPVASLQLESPSESTTSPGPGAKSKTIAHDEPPWSNPQAWQDRAAARALEEFKTRDVPAETVTFQQDEEGLDKAYADASGPGVYYDPQTHTEYIKGSVTARDWYDDITKVPAWGDLTKSERYQQAESEYEALAAAGKRVDRVVGHSLGGSVALELAKQHHIKSSRTFGAPVLDLSGAPAERFRHPLDPISIFDRSAHWGPLRAYPHTYTGFG
jgi:S-formylglutathione hydrolase FrmB